MPAPYFCFGLIEAGRRFFGDATIFLDCCIDWWNIIAMKTKQNAKSIGFALVELLVIVAGLGIITSIGYLSVTGGQAAARENKLISDASSVNRSIQMYLASGGNFNGVTDPNDILAKMKTQANAESALRRIGITGNLLDQRVRAIWQSAAEASTSMPRAIWNSAANQFEVASSGALGVKEFVLDESLAVPTWEARATTKDAAQESGWVWDFDNNTSGQPTRHGSTPFVGLVVGAAAAASQQELTGGFWTIDSPNGAVDVNYVFREAGYSSRLALVSLEGMGPENYDLTTDSGRTAFMAELVRRAAEGDRAQTIIDASQTSAGNFERTYYFRPGDTVAAVLIPNNTFQEANRIFNQGGTPGATVYPLTSLSLGTSSAPFYQGQIASLGNSGYAIEDIAGGGDADFDDLIFRAEGLSKGQGAAFREIDPGTYYPERYAQLGKGDWTRSYNGGPSLQQALINAGIIGQ
jgi:type II secretory pathway pseudopilin PulG